MSRHRRGGWHWPTVVVWCVWVVSGLFLMFAVASPVYLAVAAVNTACFVYMLLRVILVAAVKIAGAVYKAGVQWEKS